VAVEVDEPVEVRDEVLGGAVPTDAHREGFPGVLVDDVRELQASLVGGLVELEVDRPHMIPALGPPATCDRPGASAGGYKMAARIVRREGWSANRKRIQRLWRDEGLKRPPQRPRKRRRLRPIEDAKLRGRRALRCVDRC
jgi:hypothetical protein